VIGWLYDLLAERGERLGEANAPDSRDVEPGAGDRAIPLYRPAIQGVAIKISS
jgi:hypothetical protein